MHRGSHHYGVPFDSSYSRRGYNNEDGMIEIVQQFREFKPYLKKRLASIKQSGRELELQEEVEDIEFYLDVMKDILADESHGVDQLRGFIDKIHEMIRKNPLTDFQTSRRRSIDHLDKELADDDHPRSPSPVSRGSDSAANDIPVIPTHGAHRTVEVNFSSRNERPTPTKNDEYDEWGVRKFENSYTRREHYKDVDMRESFYGNNSAGRGQRRWSEENSDFSGARGVGRGLGLGRGAPPPRFGEDYRHDMRQGRGRGFSESEHDRGRNDWYLDRDRGRTTTSYELKQEKEDYSTPPDWLKGPSTNGSSYNADWHINSEHRDSGFKAEYDRRSREPDEWRSSATDNWNRNEPRDDRHHHPHQHTKLYERRPSSESRRPPERNDDFSSMFERRPKNERLHEPSSTRPDMGSPPDYSHGPSHADFHSRGREEDERHANMRPGNVYPHARGNVPGAPLINPMSSIPMTPPPIGSMGFAVPPSSMHYPNAPMIPPPFGGAHAQPPLLPLPIPPSVPNPGINLGMQNVAPPSMPAGMSHPMGFQQPPPQPLVNSYGLPEVHTSPSGYTNAGPPQQRPTHPPHHPSEHYRGASPSYHPPPSAEASAERVREISMLKAKQCFGRIVSRAQQNAPPPQSSPTSATTSSAAASGPMSPSSNSSEGASGQGSSHTTLDPRLNRVNRQGSFSTVQSRQQSPPAVPPPVRPDAGNVLRTSTSDPRAKSRMEADRRRLEETRERVRQHEAARHNSNKVSKIQELRKQFEKEGLHRLGRPVRKKQSGSFEDAIGTFSNDTDTSNKSADKNKAQSKDTDSNIIRSPSRSHSEKTDKEKSPKKGVDKNKSKDKTKIAEKDDSETTEKTSGRKKSSQNKKSPSKDTATRPGTSKSANAQDKPDSGDKTFQLAKFKIPRKPKPKPVEEEKTTTIETTSSDSSSKQAPSPPEVSLSPPASPEPALSQVPDAENRVDDGEPAPCSSKASAASSKSSSDVNPDALEFFKQFLNASVEPDDREFLMANPENLKQFFFKIKSELSAAKEKRSEDSSGNQAASGDADNEKSQPYIEEDVPERGRSREKKRNSKRRSSLEKLHDALKEMRFDTMLPLGPRRCTRGAGPEEVAAETTETPETSTTPVDTEQPQSKEEEVPVKKQVAKKRGRPPKDSPKANKGTPKGRPHLVEPEEADEQNEAEVDDSVPEATTNTPRRGRKRKLKPAKLNARKRNKKSGPLTRAQAALKKSKVITKKQTQPDENTEENTTQEKPGRKKKASNMILRRLTRGRLNANDTVVNKGLCKIKLESDYVPPVKPEPTEPDSFLNTSTNADNSDQPYLADQLTNIINENLDNDIFSNMDRHTEENMDLDVFNTLDSDEHVNEVCVKHELDIPIDEEGSSELSYERLLNTSLSPNKNTTASPTCSSSDISVIGETKGAVAAVVQNCSSSLSSKNNANKSEQACVDSKVNPSEDKSVSSESPSADVLHDVSQNKHPVLDSSSSDSSLPPSSNSAPNDLASHTLSTSTMNTSTTTCSTSTSSKTAAEEESKKENSSPVESRRSSSVSATAAADSNDSDENGKSDLMDIMSEDSSSLLSLDLKVKPEPTGEVKSEFADLDDLRKDVFKCDKCSFSGKKIIAHYVNKHAPCNIPQARLMPETFNGLIELNTSESPQLLEIVLDEQHTQVWPCLYCDDRYDCIVDFFDHLTTHTGEFRYECGECGTSYPYHKSLVNHVKLHKGVSRNCVRFKYESVVEKGSKELSGFLCNDCYYFQLRFESIMRHIEQTGHSSFDVKSVRLIRPNAGGSSSAIGVTNNGTTANVNNVVEKSNEVPDNQNTKSPEKVKQLQERNSKGASTEDELDKIDDKENECVFFGTNVNFSPPSISLNECSLAIRPVFEEPFLDSLLLRIGVDTESDFVNECAPTTESRKRKREHSAGDPHDRSSSFASSVQVPKKTAVRCRVTSRTVVTKKPQETTCKPVENEKAEETIIHTKADLTSWSPDKEDEPNDFFLSTDDESSEESDNLFSSDSDDDFRIKFEKRPVVKKDAHEPKAKSPIKIDPAVKTEVVEGLRNNEHQIKTKDENVDHLDPTYLTSRKLVPVRRPGDLHSPNTVLFGYVMPTPTNSSPKLRDVKEVDKLTSIQGKRLFTYKHVDRLREMHMSQKLIHLFKCMATFCSFTTDSPVEFQSHLASKHFKYMNRESLHALQTCSRFFPWNDIKMVKDAGCCAYCSARYKEAKDLVEHVINQHGQSGFQCNKCFYRSFYQRYVTRHFDMEHPDDICNVLKCPKKVEIQSHEATLFQIFVYKCDLVNPLCDKSKRFVFREEFLEHLRNCVPKQDTYPCHLCKNPFPFDQLIEHYKTHVLFRFHCSYCSFGSEVKTDLDEHFVVVHPNTSGRVFYRVKATPGNPSIGNVVPNEVVIPPKPVPKQPEVPKEQPTEKKKDTLASERVVKDDDTASAVSSGSDTKLEKESSASISAAESPSVDGNSIETSENEDNEKGRVTNLKGYDLYRCVTGACDFSAEDSESFKKHVTSCQLVGDSRNLSCAHCDRKMKTVTNLLEHMKVHGEKKQMCSLCAFRCWTSTEITKHIKTVHRVLSYKLIKTDIPGETDPDVIAYPKDVAARLCSLETFENNYYTFTRKAVYNFDNVEKLPQSKVFSSSLHCAFCPYSTKVRSNIVRHLIIHKQALEDGITVVPQAPRINPVPYLSRESLEFDKMMNLAASSHNKTDGGTATEDDVRKLPQFVKEQFRYVCSICDHITSDDGLLQTHIKVIHSEVVNYQCPHCQKNPETKNNPENTVSLDKISHHLKLHGPKLYKCGHCTVIHHQLRLMEKHIPEKHPEKKPIHYLIRDVDPDGVPSSRPTTSGINRRQSSDDPKNIAAEKWKCFLCASKIFFGSWEEAKSHCETVHKVNSQFMCLVCDFVSDEVMEMLTHRRDRCQSEEENTILVMFSKCETFDIDDSSVMVPVWKRNGGAVRHIHGNFTEDSVALIRQYNSQQNSDQSASSSLTSSPVRGGNVSPFNTKTTLKPTAATTSKARRSVGSPVKVGMSKTVLNVPVPTSPIKPEIFKYHCHKCDMYKTKNPNELRVHLFNEFRYKRWKCLVCSTTFTTEKSLKGHIERDHQQVYQANLYELQPANPEIEAEIDECIEKQNRKKELINSFAFEKLGKLCCKHCKEEGLTYGTFETHIMQKHSG